MTNLNTRCGLVGIIGRPNVGKSTLLNAILGEKISITSSKAQTTRHRILGIKTTDSIQTIYVDTPGLQKNIQNLLHRHMQKVTRQVLADVDVVAWMVDIHHFSLEDDPLQFEMLRTCGKPLLLIINKVDQLKRMDELLPAIEHFHKEIPEAEMVPISAKTGKNLDRFERCIHNLLPISPYLFPDDIQTDMNDDFLVCELMREKLMRYLGDELPYQMSVTIERWEEKNGCLHIHLVIWVERESHKAIVIGHHGEQMKRMASRARADIEKLLQAHVCLKTWVRVKRAWFNDETAMRTFGYDF